jgi:hypothetical protein
MENRILFLDSEGNPKNSEALTLAELQSSYQAERFGQKSITKPVEHFEFIDRILRLMERENVPTVMKKIFINKRDVELIRRKDEVVPMSVDNLSVKRMVGRFIFPSFTNDVSEYSLAYGFSDSGFEMAFGLNVKVCQNLSIFASKVYRTFGPERINLELIMNRLATWFRNLDVAWDIDNHIVTSLMNAEVTESMKHQLISETFYRSLKSTNGDPFNQGEAKSFALQIMEKPVENVWDIYNFGTNVLHPKNIGSTERVLSMNEAFGFYLLGKFPELMVEYLSARNTMENRYLETVA